MKKGLFFLLPFITVVCNITAQSLYEFPAAAQSRLSSFENPDGVKGNGGKTNKKAKGNAFEFIQPGGTKSLLNIKGQGTIRRVWLTIDQNPTKLRSLRLQMFWDDAPKAAVDVPMGDFFCFNLGEPVAFESALFSSGEGRSFNCYIPMPFRSAAKILLINDGKEPVKLYYDVDYLLEKIPASALYFHAFWTRQSTGKLGADFELLPTIKGKGRFLGMSVGLNADSSYGRSWWGEGEVKMYIDGDNEYPTINGTGAEDYIGSAWGLGKFINKYQGCTIANDSPGRFNFYRWHIPDPVYFNNDIKVTIQQIGGWGKNEVRDLYKKGVQLIPVSIDGPAGFVRLMDTPVSILDEKFPDGWVNFYRIDDYSAVSYFYLDKPASNLPSLASLVIRIKNIK
jgi:hypothetical protein